MAFSTWRNRLASLALWAAAALPAHAEDQRLAEWGRDFAAGRREAVLAAIEADLAGPEHHPLAADIWVRLEAALGRDGWSGSVQQPPEVRARLGVAPAIDLGTGPGGLGALLRAAPVRAAAATGNPALLRDLSIAAALLDRWDDALDYRIAAATQFPDRFEGAGLLLDHLAAHPSAAHAARIAALFAEGAPLAGSDIAQVVAPALDAGGGLSPGDNLGLARWWLARHPDDFQAWRYAGRQLMALERFEQAAEAFGRADGIYPFAADGRERAAALIRLGRMDDARAVAESAAARLSPSEDDARRTTLRTVIHALLDAGELGRARAAVEGALLQWPQEPNLLLDRGRIELASGRPSHAIGPLQRALAQMPSLRDARLAVAEAWVAADKPVHAWEVYKDLSRGSKLADPAFVALAMRAAEGFGDYDAAEALGADFLDANPDSPRIQRALAHSVAGLGAKARAVDLMRKAFLSSPPDAGQMEQFLQYAVFARPAAEIEADLAALRRDLPRVRAVWEASAKRRDPQDAAGRLALADQALAASPRLAWPYLDKADLLSPNAALALLDAGLAAIPARLEGQRAQLLRRRAELRGGDAGLADLDEAGRLGLAEGDYQRLRAGLLAALGRPAEAAKAAWAWSLARPDDLDAVTALFGADAVSALGLPRLFGRIHDLVARNPYDSVRRLEAVRRHAGPGGSPILALSHALALDRGAPDDPNVIQGHRLRRQVVAAVEKLGRVVDIDLAGHRLVLERADGIRIEAVFHPVSGRLLRYAQGAAWTAATWDATGTRLLELSDSAGNSLTLTWDGVGMAALAGQGDGDFRADLAADGSVRGIRSNRLAAYNEAARVIGQWVEGDLAQVPELPHRSPAFDRLRAAEARGGDDAALATAAWLVDHVGERRAWAAEALRRLDPVLARAMAAPSRHAAGLRAAGLWHRLAATLWPGGLDLPAWEHWTAIRGWALGQGAAGRDFAAAAERQPLDIAPNARWLARSWLGNPANWRLYPAEDVLAVDGHPPLAMIRRANGDLAVATASGLSVLRSGRWEHFAFNAGRNRFLGDEAGNELRGGSAITAIAEDAAGILWVAAADRLVRLSGPYDGLAENWPLPAGGVTAMAALGQGVLAAGSSGLLRFGSAGAVPLPEGLGSFAAVPLRALAAVPIPGGEPMVLAAAESGLVVWRDGKVQALYEGKVDSVEWLGAEARLAVLAGGRVLVADWKGDGRPGPLAEAVQPGELAPLGRPLGLASVIDDGHGLVVVRGERGMAFLRDGHAEFRPFTGPAIAVVAAKHAAWVAVPEGVWTVEEGVVVR